MVLKCYDAYSLAADSYVGKLHDTRCDIESVCGEIDKIADKCNASLIDVRIKDDDYSTRQDIILGIECKEFNVRKEDVRHLMSAITAMSVVCCNVNHLRIEFTV